MIKRIYQIADVHIPTYRKMDMYREQLEKLIESIGEDAKKSGLEKEEMRIVICGDIVNSKNQVTNELYEVASCFIRGLSLIAKVICIAGNHDLIESNTSRTDTLTGIFAASQFDNAVFLDDALGCSSGIAHDDNITWALYSFYDNYARPDIETAREDKQKNKVFGLYHGQIIGTKLYNDTINKEGQSLEIFNGCDYVLAGHIHKRQAIKSGDCEIVYSGSVIQKDFGESVTQHGYVIWELNNDKYEYKFVDLISDYGYYNFKIDSINDIKEDKERLTNY